MKRWISIWRLCFILEIDLIAYWFNYIRLFFYILLLIFNDANKVIVSTDSVFCLIVYNCLVVLKLSSQFFILAFEASIIFGQAPTLISLEFILFFKLIIKLLFDNLMIFFCKLESSANICTVLANGIVNNFKAIRYIELRCMN